MSPLRCIAWQLKIICKRFQQSVKYTNKNCQKSQIAINLYKIDEIFMFSYLTQNRNNISFYAYFSQPLSSRQIANLQQKIP